MFYVTFWKKFREIVSLFFLKSDTHFFFIDAGWSVDPRSLYHFLKKSDTWFESILVGSRMGLYHLYHFFLSQL